RAVLEQDDAGPAAADVDAEDPAGQGRAGWVKGGITHGLILPLRSRCRGRTLSGWRAARKVHYMAPQQTVREAWRRHITGLLDQALEPNDAATDAVAAAITTTILAGRHVYAFGAGHSLALVSEMHRRAGSIKAAVRPLWNDELTSRTNEETAGKLENR